MITPRILTGEVACGVVAVCILVWCPLAARSVEAGVALIFSHFALVMWFNARKARLVRDNDAFLAQRFPHLHNNKTEQQ